MNVNVQNQAVRPVTGSLLVGGDYYKPRTDGELWWVQEQNPSDFLFTVERLAKADAFGTRFAIPALRAPFPSFLLEIPLDCDTGTLNFRAEVRVYALPERKPWTEARFVTHIPWFDLGVDEGGVLVWRAWDDAWFRTYLCRALRKHIDECVGTIQHSTDRLVQLATFMGQM